MWTSSGTTGTPGVFVQDAAALSIYDALVSVQMVGTHAAPLERCVSQRPRRARHGGQRPLRRHQRVATAGAAQAVARHGELRRHAALASTIVDACPLRSGVRGELSDGARIARGGAERGPPSHLGSRARGPAARRSRPPHARHRGRVRLPRAQRVRRVGMLVDGLCVSPWRDARQRRLGRSSSPSTRLSPYVRRRAFAYRRC